MSELRAIPLSERRTCYVMSSGMGGILVNLVCYDLVAEYWREDGCCIIFVLSSHESMDNKQFLRKY